MISIEKRIDAFVHLGKFLRQFEKNASKNSGNELLNPLFYDRFMQVIQTAHQYNGWFTGENVIYALTGIAEFLEKDKLQKWVGDYQNDLARIKHPKNIGVVMAGNIPAVGFHDFLCVLMSGNVFLGKTSSNDKHLLPLIAEVLIHIQPDFKEYILFAESKLREIDAVIATGSNNSSRYFEYYFSKYPNLIRKNRSSMAVLDGSETEEELIQLGGDIFQYFGLGCRNVSKLFVPAGYNFEVFFKAIYIYDKAIDNNKYANNYNYNRTIYLMSSAKFLDNGFLLVKEDAGLASPVAVLYYQHYNNEKQLAELLAANESAIQCIVSKNKNIKNVVSFGKTQCPQLSDYADGVDTMAFLLRVNIG